MSRPFEVPLIDISPYLHPQKPGDKEKIISQVRDASHKYGFFQLKGHGVPLALQEGLLKALNTFFSLPKDEKMKLSFLQNPCRRGYEASGDSLREGDAMADAKESFYIGGENPTVEPPGFYGPNNWPDMAYDDFHGPVWDYYLATKNLGQTIWEILLEGLGHSPSIMEKFAKKPIVPMKMIRYPPLNVTKPGQFGVGPHNDFGGVTVLLQQPGKDGLEVLCDNGEWMPIPAVQDVYVINCGDMIQRWSGGQYKSARHRVINKSDDEQRLSCATFWHGDSTATNPLNPDDPNRDTVGQLLFKRFNKQFSLPKAMGEVST